MGLFNFKKKTPQILSERDKEELKELQRVAYMEEAKKLIVEKGKAQAHTDIKITEDPNKPKKSEWDL